MSGTNWNESHSSMGDGEGSEATEVASHRRSHRESLYPSNVDCSADFYQPIGPVRAGQSRNYICRLALTRKQLRVFTFIARSQSSNLDDIGEAVFTGGGWCRESARIIGDLQHYGLVSCITISGRAHFCPTLLGTQVFFDMTEDGFEEGLDVKVDIET